MKLSRVWSGLIVLALAVGSRPPGRAADWREFRGPDRSGVSDAKDVPTTWDAKTNVLWKTPLPGPGTSSPVLFGERVYLTCYTGYGLDAKNPGDHRNLKRHLLYVNKADGRVVWDAPAAPKVAEPGYGGFTALHGYASSTPAVDADGVYVYYGASGLAAYSHDGTLRWEKSCGTRQHDGWGSGSSPVLYKDLVIIHADVESETIFAFDRKTGREVWKRTFPPQAMHSQHTRATPLVVRRPGGDELVIHSRMTWVSSLDLATGNVLWEFNGTKSYQHASIVTDGERLYALTYQHGVALKPDGKPAWEINRGTEICTPVCHDGHLYWTDEQSGVAYCVGAATGKVVYAERLTPAPGRIYASGVLAGGRIYYVSREKGTYVVEAKPRFELVAHNVIEDDRSVFNATPAPEDGRIYLRSDKYLYCIGRK